GQVENTVRRLYAWLQAAVGKCPRKPHVLSFHRKHASGKRASQSRTGKNVPSRARSSPIPFYESKGAHMPSKSLLLCISLVLGCYAGDVPNARSAAPVEDLKIATTATDWPAWRGRAGDGVA